MAERHFRLFLEEIGTVGERLALPTAQARIVRTILRLKKGQRIELLNGKGAISTAELLEVGSKRCGVLVVDQQEYPPHVPEISLIMGLPKGDKSAWVVQKAVEWGVSKISFVETDHNVVQRRMGQKVRWMRIALEAIRQSGNPYLPDIEDCMPLAQALQNRTHVDLSLCCETGKDIGKMRDVLSNSAAQTLQLAVGPEGGFSDMEKTLFIQAGFQLVSLGAHVLRTETAAISAIAVCRVFFQ